MIDGLDAFILITVITSLAISIFRKYMNKYLDQFLFKYLYCRVRLLYCLVLRGTSRDLSLQLILVI